MTSSMIGSAGFKNAAGSPSLGNTSGGFKEKIPKGYKAGALQQFSPEQMQLFQQLFSNVGPDSYLSRLAGGDESIFKEIEAPAFRQFQELQGDIGSRFSNMGMGARRGSGFQNSANQQSSDFAMQLQSQRQGLQQQAIKDLMGLSSELLGQRPFERTLTEKSKPWWQEAATAFSGGLGQGLGRSATSG